MLRHFEATSDCVCSADDEGLRLGPHGGEGSTVFGVKAKDAMR